MSAAEPGGEQGVRQLTARGTGGVAVLRVAGTDALRELEALFGRSLPAPGEVAYGVLRDQERVLDEVLVVGGEGGHVELHLHGGPALVGSIGARLGGFNDGGTATRLSERAAVAVAAAPSILGARILIDQAGGALTRALGGLRPMSPADRRRAIENLARAGERCAPLLRETVVVLVGEVNAGKSTLFNLLVGEDAAIVADVPGTTRDTLAMRTEVGPWPVVLVDTAGTRDLADALSEGDRSAQIEAQGQTLGAGAAARADVVLELVPAGGGRGAPSEPTLGQAPADAAAGPRVVRLRSRAAECSGESPALWGPGTLSAREAPGHARQVVEGALRQCLQPSSTPPSGVGAQPAPLWTPGAPVPFESWQVERLARLAEGGPVDDATTEALLSAFRV